MLEKISRTRVKLRQGRQKTWVTVPVDFSDLSSEYIGILYEGLLDFELKTAPAGNPVIFLAVGNQPALPLSRLEEMDDRALAALLEKMKDTSSGDDEESEEADEAPDEATADAADEGDDPDDEVDEEGEEDSTDGDDDRHVTRTRAEVWARRAVEAGRLVRRPRATATAETRRAYDESVARKARQLVVRVVLPGEWYLVRWGGTRKGSGTFYTRPGLAVPTVQRTLRPLLYDPPAKDDGTADLEAPASSWLPKRPEEILAIKTCDSACGSGTFPVAALRYITDALYASVHHHGRVADRGDRSVVSLLSSRAEDADDVAALGQELIPCPSEDASFEPRLRAVLKRHVVERCIYGVDLDPLAVELCRLSLWIETMDRTLPFSFLDHKVKCGNALVGTWFDQFLHYPVMAWKNREGGDKSHSNGVHFAKEARGKALRDFAMGALKTDLKNFLSGPTLFDPRDKAREATEVHDDALALLAKLHDLPVQDAAERARIYREELLAAPAYKSLKAAMDLWCACWFWPAEALDDAPLPSRFAEPSDATCSVATEITNRLRFFHWELEFPDVFSAKGSGFNAVIGNPPWDIAKPNSMEFFSNIDPLYRAYGKQEALRKQSAYFAIKEVENSWLDYNSDSRALSNFMKYAAAAFGDPGDTEVSNDRFSIVRGRQNNELHAGWRSLRSRTAGYADPEHPYQHQGSADLNLYKAFLERSYALMRHGGRLGYIVPSGIYSDYGTGALRRLFIDMCRWEWLFNFINWKKIFPSVYYRFKFNALVVEKGGQTDSIRAAFVRTRVEDWESAETVATDYSRAQVLRFSPSSRAILEIQSEIDLEILGRIYTDSLLMSDRSPDGWNIDYGCEFHMTNDSRLFPPLSKWEDLGYKPDEYSRWLKGEWRPISELLEELGAKESDDMPACIRAIQPQYSSLGIPRADLPRGVVLDRECRAWMHEDDIKDIGLPLYEGRMIGQHDFSQKGWVSGRGRSSVWRLIDPESKPIEPQFLMASDDYKASGAAGSRFKVAIMDVTSSTNARTVIASALGKLPAGHKTPTLSVPCSSMVSILVLCGFLNSLVFDFAVRSRLGGNSLVWAVLGEAAIPTLLKSYSSTVSLYSISLSCCSVVYAPEWIRFCGLAGSKCTFSWRRMWASAEAERSRCRVVLDALFFSLSGLQMMHACWILRDCDHPLAGFQRAARSFDPNGFWRVDKEKDPELRHTILTLVALRDLEEKIREHGGDREAGIEAFLTQNDGEGWLLPETLRLADYGLGHDERALEHQPVASRLGPRFYDWQLAQSAEESWRECHLHARNLLGEAGYQQLLAEIEAERSGQTVAASPPPALEVPLSDDQQLQLFS